MNRIIKLIFIISFVGPIFLHSQVITWTRYYDYMNSSDFGVQGIQTIDGGYAFLSINSYNDFVLKKNILITKTNALGVVEFQKIITDSTVNGLTPGAFQQTNDSGFIIAGRSLNTGILIKTDKYANVWWRKDYARPGTEVSFKTLTITNDGGYICGGKINSRLYILKADTKGNVQWDSIYTGFQASDIIQNRSGFFYLVNGNILRKLNPNGGIVWEIDTAVSAQKVLEHPNGYIYVLKGPILSKYDTLGNFYWTKNYFTSFPQSVYFEDLCIDKQYNINLAGYISDPYTNFPDLFLAKLDTGGAILYKKIIMTGEKDLDYLYTIAPTPDNGFICAGVTSYATSTAFWNTIALKTDSIFNTTPIVNVNNNNVKLPSEFILYQNYPNPFNSETIIKIELNRTSNILLNLYDVAGRLIGNIYQGHLNPGKHELLFNKELPSGVYYYSLRSENYTIVKKMLIIK